MKNITSYTPGPWEMNDMGLILGQRCGEDDEAPLVADVSDNLYEFTEQEAANGRLISAAPDLLEALQTIARVFGTDLDNLGAKNAALIRAAIAKATGQ